MMLNVGCGDDLRGDVRVDVVKTKATNVVCDIEESLPFKAEVFQVVYAKFVMEHLRNPGRFLSESKRVLREGGKVVLVTDNAGCIGWYLPRMRLLGISTWAHEKYHYSANPSDAHYAIYLPGHMANHLRKIGFTNVKIQYFWGENLVNRGILKEFLEMLRTDTLRRLFLPHFQVEADK